eukprot:4826929-Pyramimonas_sp.AAC.1
MGPLSSFTVLSRNVDNTILLQIPPGLVKRCREPCDGGMDGQGLEGAIQSASIVRTPGKGARPLE